MAMIERLINVTFQLANDTFSNGQDTLTVTGLRCEAVIDDINGINQGSLQLRIYGMKIEDMNAMSLLGKRYLEARRNVITVTAGDMVNGMQQVFKGTIYQGSIDYAGMPDVGFNIAASSGYFENVQSSADFSMKGDVSVATIIESIAKGMGFSFLNNGVDAKLSNPHLEGSPLAQIMAVAQAAHVACNVSQGVVAIWPNGGTRDDQIVDISPATGLVGYPVYSQYGIDVTTLFNPNLMNGRKAKVTSDAIGATGDWYVQVTRHELSSQSKNGPWFTTAQLTGEGFYVAH